MVLRWTPDSSRFIRHQSPRCASQQSGSRMIMCAIERQASVMPQRSPAPGTCLAQNPRQRRSPPCLAVHAWPPASARKSCAQRVLVSNRSPVAAVRRHPTDARHAQASRPISPRCLARPGTRRCMAARLASVPASSLCQLARGLLQTSSPRVVSPMR